VTPGTKQTILEVLKIRKTELERALNTRSDPDMRMRIGIALEHITTAMVEVLEILPERDP
jgi:predicted metal-dependent hydrolase